MPHHGIPVRVQERVSVSGSGLGQSFQRQDFLLKGVGRRDDIFDRCGQDYRSLTALDGFGKGQVTLRVTRKIKDHVKSNTPGTRFIQAMDQFCVDRPVPGPAHFQFLGKDVEAEAINSHDHDVLWCRIRASQEHHEVVVLELQVLDQRSDQRHSADNQNR